MSPQAWIRVACVAVHLGIAQLVKQLVDGRGGRWLCASRIRMPISLADSNYVMENQNSYLDMVRL